ncbi:CcdB family protein [Klebsiella aerogenes]|uniref:CcdB family protein n=1 Tax=Klebsiella aerogenes TaxID=548 RepID=UPI000D855121|nr:CcdB family protein [Klebsiella aerogenes]PYZ48252.1 plasmid maintenance protein CcdB [Klebsiella aerogenes]
MQFDVYRNPSPRTNELQPYLMVIQHDYYDDLSSRLVLPLSYHIHMVSHYHPAAPLVNLDFQKPFLNTPGITSVAKQRLNNKYFVCNLHKERTAVISAIDALITNT